MAHFRRPVGGAEEAVVLAVGGAVAEDDVGHGLSGQHVVEGNVGDVVLAAEDFEVVGRVPGSKDAGNLLLSIVPADLGGSFFRDAVLDDIKLEDGALPVDGSDGDMAAHALYQRL